MSVERVYIPPGSLAGAKLVLLVGRARSIADRGDVAHLVARDDRHGGSVYLTAGPTGYVISHASLLPPTWEEKVRRVIAAASTIDEEDTRERHAHGGGG